MTGMERTGGLVYLGVALIIFTAVVGYSGYLHQRGERGSAGELIPPAVFGSLLWPMGVAVALLSLPWWAGAAVGKLAGLRESRRLRRSADEVEVLTRLRDAFRRDEPEWALLNEKIRSLS